MPLTTFMQIARTNKLYQKSVRNRSLSTCTDQSLPYLISAALNLISTRNRPPKTSKTSGVFPEYNPVFTAGLRRYFFLYICYILRLSFRVPLFRAVPAGLESSPTKFITHELQTMKFNRVIFFKYRIYWVRELDLSGKVIIA